MSKTLLGISYILLAIPYINIVGVILLPIAWIIEGRRRKKGLWTATGILGLISVILIIVGMAVLIGAVLPLIGSLQHEITAGQGQPPQIFPGNFTRELLKKVPVGLAGIAVMAVASLLYVVYFILMLVSLYQAGSFYRSGLIKASAILYVVGIVVMILFVVIIITQSASHAISGAGGVFVGGLLIGVIIAGILLFISNILAGIGFLTAKEPEEQQYYAYGYAPQASEGTVRTGDEGSGLSTGTG